MCVCVCVHSESDIWHISQDELPATPKIKPTTTTKATETANALLKLPSLSCPCRHTHMQTHTHRMNFPSIRARISPAFGTLVLGVGYFSCRLLQPVQFAVDARLVRVVFIGVSKIRKKKNQFAFSEIASAIRFFARVESFLKRRKSYPRIFFFPYFFSRTLLSSAVGVNLSPQRGCLEIHPLGCSRSVPLHPPVASISTTTTKPVLKSIFPNCLATRIIIVVRIACSKTTPNPYRNLLYYTIYHMYICYGYGLLRGNELLIL